MRTTWAWMACLVLGVATSNSAVGQFSEMKHKSGIDYARNNAWPQPFRGADANSVMAPFEIMRSNGWREHNTVGTPLFSTEHCLSEAGLLKVQWIVTQAPQNQRVVYVKTGRTSEETAARVESVQLAVSQLIPTGPLPQILTTEIEPTTSSGSYQTVVHRALVKTTPTPRLNAFTGLNKPSQQTVAPAAGSGK
ncbi:MAG: hypothetical protein ABL921_06990 [Pirellula sp.]